MSHQASDSSPKYAPWTAVPGTNLIVVEHPGCVRNVDNGVASLGGAATLGRALNARSEVKRLNLHFRPGNSFRRPIPSSHMATQNVVLRVTVPKRTGRKRKRGSSEPFALAEPDKCQASPRQLIQSLADNPNRYTVEAVGSSTETHRFRVLPDFQYGLTQSPMAKSLHENVLSFDYDKMKNFTRDFDPKTRGAQPNMDMIPPPSFTQLDIPYNYQYHQNPSVKLTTDEQGRLTSFNTTMPRRTVIQLVDYNAPTVPSTHPPDLIPVDALESHVRELIAELQGLLATRPIITRRVARNLLPHRQQRDIQTALQYVGFVFRSGPWRDAIVSFGLDPRTDPSCRIYQTHTFQIPLRNSHPAAPPTASPDPAAAIAPKYARPIRLDRTTDTTSHLFCGTKLTADGKIWQVVDITDPQLAALLAAAPVRATCHARSDGWYPNGTWAAVHVLMRDKLAALAAGRAPGQAEYARLIARVPAVVDERSVQRTLVAGLPGVTAKEVQLASEIRALAKESAAKDGGRVGGAWAQAERIGEVDPALEAEAQARDGDGA